MILIVDPGKQYPSEQGRVFRVIIQEETRYGSMSTWKQPPEEELPCWLAQCILKEAHVQLQEGA